jgi:hypothetical protein
MQWTWLSSPIDQICVVDSMTTLLLFAIYKDLKRAEF